jgi:c-di-GMP-related signal transduction protein
VNEEKMLLGRQPILDRRGHMYAYELLFRDSGRNAASVPDAVLATSQVLHHVFAEIGVERALGPYRGFLNCDARMLMLPGVLDILPTRHVVLEVLETVEPTPAVVARCQVLKAAGFMLALDDYTGEGARYAGLLPLVDVLKIDLGAVPPASLARVVAEAHRVPALLLAEKVETREQAQVCEQLGFDLFQGYYFARPTILSGRKLGLPQMALMRILTLLMQDADTPLIEEVFKQQPGLSVNLLKLANSAALSRAERVNSLAQAIVVLGRRHLQRWVQLLLYTDPGRGDIENPLLQLAATRGHLMESMAARMWSGRRDRADQAFMVGIMSLMPALFTTPLAEILAQLPLPQPVCDALLARRGPIGELLERIEALEARPLDATLLPAGIDQEAFNASLAEAMTWANRIGQASVAAA